MPVALEKLLYRILAIEKITYPLCADLQHSTIKLNYL